MLNFQRLFESIPGLYIIYDLDFVIVGGSDAYFQATLTKREEVVGRHLFEVFPDNPDDPNADGVRNLRTSLENVLKYGKPHTMAVQKYDVRRPEAEGGGFEERYWAPANSPLFDENGVMTHIIHRAVDVTEFVQMQQQRNEQRQLNQALQSRTEQMEMEIYARAQELQAINAQLQTANEALSELDRAKTAFFSNVSHEFRTPLTLMLSPLEDTIATLKDTISPSDLEQLQLIQRNGLRLLKLVNSLLDFARLEAGRVQADYEPVDLATYTAELASTFQSLIERAGLSLIIDCSPLPTAVYADRDMWEKIVLNLLSNAFKFTLAGTITVRLQEFDDWVELLVADTGVGIPSEELPHLFERFHRVENSQGRSFEGSGIGLSLVQELIKLHGGKIEVISTLGQGSCFTVTIPTGTAHLPSERIGTSRTLASTAVGALPYVEEAQRWLQEESYEFSVLSFELDSEASLKNSTLNTQTAAAARILLADDNTDMRHYIQRLLSGTYTVETVVDGVAALDAIAKHPPDLVLTDMMMPRMDGLELLRSLRSQPHTQDIPIILLSARAGEEAYLEGLTAGADDYLVKPFSARELQTRVEATLKLSKLRREALQQEQVLRAMSETAQQQAEAAFRRIDQLLESMSEAFIALDHDWQIIYQNATSEQINQKPRSLALGKTLWEEWPAIVGSISEQQYRHAVAEQVAVHFEQHYYEPPDHDMWLEVHAYPFAEGLGIFYRDVSERKRAEEISQRAAALDAFRVSLADALRPLTDASEIQAIAARILGESLRATRVIYVEVISDGEEVIVHRNYTNGVAEMSGRYRLEDYRRNLTADHQAGHTQIVIDIPNNPKYTDAEKAKYRELDIAAHIDVPLIKNDQFVALLAVHQSTPRQWTETEVKLVEETAERTWAAVERARAEAALREGENRLRLALVSAELGTWDFNPITDVLQWDNQCKAMFGLSPEAEITYDVFLAGLHPEDRDRADQVVQLALKPESGGEYDLEYRTIGIEDGVERWIAAKGKAFFNPAGSAIRFIGTVLNITEKKQVEAEREQLLQWEQAAREAAETANRIKDEFLAVLSHELRSPLNPILGWSKVLLQGKLDAARTTAALTTIERNAQLQVQLIDDLLDISRILRGKLSLTLMSVDLYSVILAALETVRLAAEAKGIQIHTAALPGTGIITGDAGRLQQVLWNLLSNAVKFTPANGQVTVTLRAIDRHAQIQVSDTGKGIKPEFLPYVFEHFRQEDGATTRKFGGLGLGLAIARQIVELHGGTIAVNSPGEGKGATFIVQLPAMRQATPIQAEPNYVQLSSETLLDKVHILLVDDDRDTLEFEAFLLEQHGAQVTAVSSGLEALQALEQMMPDVIVSDVGMADMDGYMLMRQIRLRAPTEGGMVPAIALTAYAAEIDQKRAIQAGFQRHLTKPLEPERLVGEIVNLLNSNRI
ncbi:MAG TPA: ATP-binding protein [Coleofasciculaceae cyanobacterium]|jgi:PAS domain S-box-containing protein